MPWPKSVASLSAGACFTFLALAVTPFLFLLALGLLTASPALCPGSGNASPVAEKSELPFPAPASPAALPKLPTPPSVLARFTVPLIESASEDDASSTVEDRSFPGTAAAALSDSIFLPFLELLGAIGTIPARAVVFASFFATIDVDSSGTLPLRGFSGASLGPTRFAAASVSDLGSAAG